MLYNQCAGVNEEFWRNLRQANQGDVARRTGVQRHQQVFRFPYFNQEAVVDLDQQRVFRAASPAEEPGFRLCLITLLYLLFVDTRELGPPLSPLELPGATTFFQSRGPHAIPSAPLEERFGLDLPRVSGGRPAPGGGKSRQRRRRPGLAGLSGADRGSDPLGG